MENSTPSILKEDDLPPFGRLSIDLVLQIADLLPIESVFALALTTKPLYYSQALQKAWKSDPRLYPDRCAQLIARYTPERIYCAFCKRLHPRRTTPKITDDWSSLDPCPHKQPPLRRQRTALEIIDNWASLPPISVEPPRLVWLHLNPWEYHLQFEDVYKVMIRHLWGAPWGDDLESLAVETDWQALAYSPTREDPNGYLKTPAQCLVRLTVKPEIVADKLILRTIQRIWYDRDVWNHCKPHALECPLRACQHATRPGLTSSIDDLLAISRQGLRFPRPHLPWQQKRQNAMVKSLSQHCFKCMSRFFLVFWNHDQTGVELAMYTWTDLGMCDYDLSNEWTVATNTEWKPFHERWHIYNRNHGLDHVSDVHEQITEADSEICHRSFERAKQNLALRNQRLHALQLCSKDENSQDTVVSSRRQEDHSEQTLLKKQSRVSRFVSQVHRSVWHPFGRSKS